MAEIKIPVRLALVGCGAVVEQFYAPAILKQSDVVVSALVDSNPQRASRLLAQFPGAEILESIAEKGSLFDAAVVAVPHNLHAEICCALLNCDKHVLVEKPMAHNLSDCDQMIQANQKSRGTLSIGQMRRFAPSIQLGKKVLDAGILGTIKQFRIFEGDTYDWPVQTPFVFDKKAAGGGVLIDNGAHTLDILLWYFGSFTEIYYKDDSFGGVEADCIVDLKTPTNISGHLELSRTRKMSADLEIIGEKGDLNVNYKTGGFKLRLKNDVCLEYQIIPVKATSEVPSIWHYMIEEQFRRWIQGIQDQLEPFVSGEEGRKVVELIQRCYENRRALEMPWQK